MNQTITSKKSEKTAFLFPWVVVSMVILFNSSHIVTYMLTDFGIITHCTSQLTNTNLLLLICSLPLGHKWSRPKPEGLTEYSSSSIFEP